MQQLTCARAAPKVDGSRMPTIDEIDPASGHVEPGVTNGDKAFKADELPSYLRRHQRDDLLGLCEPPLHRWRKEAVDGTEKVALGGGAKECGGDTLAHDVANNDVKTLVAVRDEFVEVAIDALRWDRQRGELYARKTAGRLAE